MRIALLLALVGSAAVAGDDAPPPGPHWARDFHAARLEALKSGRLLCLCFVDDRPSSRARLEKFVAGMEPAWKKVAWLHVRRGGRGADLVERRFAVTRWPRFLLVYGRTLEPRYTGGGFLPAIDKPGPSPERWREAERVVRETREAELQAVRLERRRDVEKARKAIGSDDILLRWAGVRVLAEKEPAALVEKSISLLAVRNEPYRCEVCDALGKAADPAANEALEWMLKEHPLEGTRPRSVRSAAVGALAVCGDAGSVEILAALAASDEARSGPWYGLAGEAVDALGLIAARHEDAREKVRAALKPLYPPLPTWRTKGTMEACLDFARRIHRARHVETPFPDPYDEKAREALMK